MFVVAVWRGWCVFRYLAWCNRKWRVGKKMISRKVAKGAKKDFSSLSLRLGVFA
jgi:hypothetical protein